MLRFLTAAACAALMLLAATSARAGVVIDSFDTAQRQDTDPATSFGPAGTVTTAGTDILGGERDVSVFQNSGFGSVGVNIDPLSSSLAMYNEDSGTDGRFLMVYDGIDGNPGTINYTGLGGINLTTAGGPAHRFIFQGYDSSGASNPIGFKLTVYTDQTNYLEYTFSVPGGTTGDIVIPFSAFTQTGNGSFTNVGAIVWEGDTNTTNASHFSVDGILTSNPEPSSLVLLGLGIAGLALFGLRRRRNGSDATAA
jgi:PEP-CTERM motif